MKSSLPEKIELKASSRGLISEPLIAKRCKIFDLTYLLLYSAKKKNRIHQKTFSLLRAS